MINVLKVAALAVLLGVVATAAVSLLSSPVEAAGRWFPCPFPPCAAPCVLGAEPTVQCRQPGSGQPVETTFACCCCGGGGTTFYRPL